VSPNKLEMGSRGLSTIADLDESTWDQRQRLAPEACQVLEKSCDASDPWPPARRQRLTRGPRDGSFWRVRARSSIEFKHPACAARGGRWG